MSLPALNQHWLSLYDKKFLHAGKLWDEKAQQYKSVTVTIDRFEQRPGVDMGDGKKSTVQLLHFRGATVPLIVTPKMATVLVRMFGPTPKDAEGRQITLYVERGFKTTKGTGDVLRIKNEKAGRDLKDQIRSAQTMPALPDDPDQGP